MHDIWNSLAKFFEVIPNGTSLVRLGRNLDEIRQWVSNNKNCLILIIDNINELTKSTTANVASILLGTPDSFNSVEISVNFDEIAMKYQIFKQIISITKEEIESTTPTSTQVVATPTSHGKQQKAAKRSSSKIVPNAPKPQLEEKQTSFAKEALKMNNPDFEKFIDDLNETFKPVTEIIPENCPEAILILSSQEKVHSIPFECITAFENFQIIYRDFSIMSALNRKSPCTNTPTFGETI